MLAYLINAAVQKTSSSKVRAWVTKHAHAITHKKVKSVPTQQRELFLECQRIVNGYLSNPQSTASEAEVILAVLAGKNKETLANYQSFIESFAESFIENFMKALL